MGNYKVYDGQGNWLDPCNHEIYFLDDQLGWQLIDPNTREILYHDGTYTGNWPTWKPMNCECLCNTELGFKLNPETDQCEKLDIQSPACTGGCQTYNLTALTKSSAFGWGGMRLYNTTGFNPPYKASNSNLGLATGIFDSPNQAMVAHAGYDKIRNPVWGGGGTFTNPVTGTTCTYTANPDSRMNKIGLWATGWPGSTKLSFDFCLTLTETKTYIIGLSGDNECHLDIQYNSAGPFVSVIEMYGNDQGSNNYWHCFPIELPIGTHILRLSGKDYATPAGFGAEIYDVSVADFKTYFGKVCEGIMDTVGSTLGLNDCIIWSTAQFINITPPLKIPAPNQLLPATYTCPDGYVYDGCLGVPICRKLLVDPCL